jgi:sulfite reductase alpha subunit-like flavoprotein
MYEITCVRRLVSRLKQLGAQEILPVGLGDDQAMYGYLTALDGWITSLVSILRPQVEVHDIFSPVLEPPQYDISFPDLVPKSFTVSVSPPEGYEVTTTAPISARVVSNSRITSPTWNQNVFHMALQLEEQGAGQGGPSHVAGDVLVVYPENPPDVVDLALSIFSSRGTMPAQDCSLTAGTVISFERRRISSGSIRRNRLGEATCTLRDLFSRLLDITAVPQRSFFEALSLFSSNEEEREKLLELSSSEGADLYYNYCLRERRGYMEVLSEFKSCSVPLQRLPELIPPLRPRHYSIASSGMSHCFPHEVSDCYRAHYSGRLLIVLQLGPFMRCPC